MDYILLRRQGVAKAVARDGLAALLVTAPANVRYLTGTDAEGFLVVSAGRPVFLTDGRFADDLGDGLEGVDVVVRPVDRPLPAAAAAVLAALGAVGVGLEAGHCTLDLAEYLRANTKAVTFAAVGGAVEAQRAVKDPGEVAAIREAVRVTERAFGMFRATLREADSEKDMADALDGYLRRAGARRAAFPVIAAAGASGAKPHATPAAGRRLGDASKLLVDWGADVGYKADLTRTLRTPFAPAPTRKTKAERAGHDFARVFAAVAAAQDAAAAACRHGVPAADVDAAARTVLAAAGYADRCTHGLGHGIGLDVHEAPRIRPGSPDVLAAGMVVTLEPAVYLPGWGGVRIEDDFLVTADGATRLSTLPRDPEPIG